MKGPSGKRRRFQFSLRTLLIAVAVIVVLLAGWRLLVGPYYRQHATMAMIERMNGPHGEVGTYETEAADTWLAQLSPGYFKNVVRVFLFEPSDEVLENVAALPELKVLTIRQGVRDNQLRLLASAKSLRALHIIYAPIDGTGLVHLTALPNLLGLQLDGTLINDRHLVHLRALGKLRSISLYRTPITNEGLIHLEGLNKLEELDLSETKVDDAGLVGLVP